MSIKSIIPAVMSGQITDVERDNVSGVIYADDLRAWLSRWQTLKTKITPITAGSGE